MNTIILIGIIGGSFLIGALSNVIKIHLFKRIYLRKGKKRYDDIYTSVYNSLINGYSATFITRKLDSVYISVRVASIKDELILNYSFNENKILLYNTKYELFLDDSMLNNDIKMKIVNAINIHFHQQINDFVVVSEPSMVEKTYTHKEFEQAYGVSYEKYCKKTNDLNKNLFKMMMGGNPNMMMNDNMLKNFFSKNNMVEDKEKQKRDYKVDEILNKIDIKNKFKKLTPEEITFLKNLK